MKCNHAIGVYANWDAICRYAYANENITFEIDEKFRFLFCPLCGGNLKNKNNPILEQLKTLLIDLEKIEKKNIFLGYRTTKDVILLKERLKEIINGDANHGNEI